MLTQSTDVCKDNRAQQILNILSSAGAAPYIGESVSQLEHALQCAFLATVAKASDTMVLAALLHDVGHIGLQGSSDLRHDERGARLLSHFGFAQDIVSLVLGHFEVKRYLVFRNRRYLTRLSWETRRVLNMQGGPMTAQEAEVFERDPLFKARLALREWDERAKVANLQVPQLEAYRGCLERYLAQSS